MRARVALIPAGLLALGVLAYFLDAATLQEAAGYALENPLGLFTALAAYTGAFVLRALAWRPVAGGPVPVRRLFFLLLAALFLNHAAPAKAGDFARMYGIAKRGVPGGEAAAGVILARLADLASLLIVLAVFWTLAGETRPEVVAIPAAAVIFLGGALWIFARVRLGAWVPRYPLLRRLTGPAGKLRRALRETSPRAVLAAFLWAAPAWVLEAGILVFVARGVGLDLSFSGAVAATGFAVLVTAVPLTPGSLGTYEAGMVFILVALGAAPETAFVAAVVSHGLKFLYAFAAAPFAFIEGVAAVRKKGVAPDEVRVEV